VRTTAGMEFPDNQLSLNESKIHPERAHHNTQKHTENFSQQGRRGLQPLTPLFTGRMGL
jgi:hypothetical protein